MLYLEGGNAQHLAVDLPRNVRIAANANCITGSIHLWDEVVWRNVRGIRSGEALGLFWVRSMKSPAQSGAWVPSNPNATTSTGTDVRAPRRSAQPFDQVEAAALGLALDGDGREVPTPTTMPGSTAGFAVARLSGFSSVSGLATLALTAGTPPPRRSPECLRWPPGSPRLRRSPSPRRWRWPRPPQLAQPSSRSRRHPPRSPDARRARRTSPAGG